MISEDVDSIQQKMLQASKRAYDGKPFLVKRCPAHLRPLQGTTKEGQRFVSHVLYRQRLAGSLIGSLKTVTKVSRGFDSCRTHFLCGKKKEKKKKKRKKKEKKEEASPQGKNRAMWEEEAKPLKHKNDAERKSDL